MTGLQGSSVKRLNKTWELVDPALVESFRLLCAEMAFEKNFKAYRELLKTAGTPCLPYLGVYLTDLTFIEARLSSSFSSSSPSSPCCVA